MLEIPDSESDPEQILVSASLEENLQNALNALPDDFRVAVIMADIEGLSYEEIANAMHCSLGTVRSRLHRGRKMVRQFMNAHLEPTVQSMVTEIVSAVVE